MSFNFAVILFWLLVATGAIWLLDAVVLKRRRRVAADEAVRQFDQQSKAQTLAAPHAQARADEGNVIEERKRLREHYLRQPGWIEFPAGFFPVILVVFVLRSFLVEPFRIPSGSMIPTLMIGDLILVNKFTYGVRLPIVNKKIVDVGSPERGDVMVFRYPVDPSVDYVKRVIGLPGDTIAYRNKRLSINGQPVQTVSAADYFDSERVTYTKQFVEKLPRASGFIDHMILQDDERSGVIIPGSFAYRGNCVYSDGNTAITCKVPDGQYFMMGDNRDNSADSRYWGFVPEENIVGKAFFIWMNFGNMHRIGSFH